LATAPTPMDHPINPNNDLGTKEWNKYFYQH
jgi:hypothetical protein